MTSLIAWLGKMGLSIHVNGPTAPNPSSELVYGDRDRLISLANRGIVLVGEESSDPPHLAAGKSWIMLGSW